MGSAWHSTAPELGQLRRLSDPAQGTELAPGGLGAAPWCSLSLRLAGLHRLADPAGSA